MHLKRVSPVHIRDYHKVCFHLHVCASTKLALTIRLRWLGCIRFPRRQKHHQLRIHGLKSSERVCPACNKEFTTHDALIKHCRDTGVPKYEWRSTGWPAGEQTLLTPPCALPSPPCSYFPKRGRAYREYVEEATASASAAAADEGMHARNCSPVQQLLT